MVSLWTRFKLVSRSDMTSSRPTTWPSSSSHQSEFGYALMSPRPPWLAAQGDLHPTAEWNVDRSKAVGGVSDVSEVVTIFGFEPPGIVTEHECTGSQA